MTGRFDALTQLEEKPIQNTSPIEVKEEKVHKSTSPQTGLPTKPQAHMSTSPQVDKPASRLVDKSTSGQTRNVALEKPDRYTTRLLPSMVKKIKAYAFQNDIDDYDVVQKALQEFFERNK